MGFFLPADARSRRLTFSDFTTRQLKPPAPGKTGTAALTAVNMVLQPNTFNFQPAAFLKPPNFKMVEEPDVTVALDSGRMFVASWVFTMPATFQASLLSHEQGHYEISMLNAGDVFTELQDINAGAFPSAAAGNAAIRTVVRTLFNVQAIHNKYDVDTRNGLNATLQASWDAALLAARVTFVRPTLRTALRTAGLFP